MPIKDKSVYSKDWKQISRSIRQRDGHNHMVGAAGSGHMGEPIPHYQKVNRFNYWTQGTCYADVDMKSDYVWFDNLVFTKRDNLLVTKIGQRMLAQEIDTATAANSASAAA